MDGIALNSYPPPEATFIILTWSSSTLPRRLDAPTLREASMRANGSPWCSSQNWRTKKPLHGMEALGERSLFLRRDCVSSQCVWRDRLDKMGSLEGHVMGCDGKIVMEKKITIFRFWRFWVTLIADNCGLSTVVLKKYEIFFFLILNFFVKTQKCDW